MNEIAEKVLRLQSTEDQEERNDFIRDFIPFIVNSVSKTTGRYINKEDSDEFIIGMSGFNESIDKYNPDKGAFIRFAELVIRSRVTDYLRKEMKHAGDVPLDEQLTLHDSAHEGSDLSHEIKAFKERLSYFDLEFEDLVEQSPKHTKTRREVDELGREVSEDDPICSKLYSSKKLPMAEIVLKYHTTKKRLKTYRNYIIGIIVVYKEKLDGIKGYISPRGDSDE